MSVWNRLQGIGKVLDRKAGRFALAVVYVFLAGGVLFGGFSADLLSSIVLVGLAAVQVSMAVSR